jgi:putative DNA methylase
MNRRLIEERFPLKEINEICKKEKRDRFKTITTVHHWWARRPLTASRATIFASLINYSQKKSINSSNFELIKKISQDENFDYPYNFSLFDDVSDKIFKENDNKKPKILDPFAGGGSIPFEASRLGCETFASDLNPVSNLILKCVLNFAIKTCGRERKKNTITKDKKNKFLEDFSKWNKWVYKKSQNELNSFYQDPINNEKVVGYIWSKFIKCKNPRCKKQIPLFNNYWLVKKDKRKISLFPYENKGEIVFKIIGDGHEKFPKSFDPKNGTISNGIATCIACKTKIVKKELISIFQKAEWEEKLIAVFTLKKGTSGKNFRIALSDDFEKFNSAEQHLDEYLSKLKKQSISSPIPDEIIRTPDGKEYSPGGLYFNFTTVVLYGFTKWNHLFNSRQKLALVIFSKIISDAQLEMKKEGYDDEYVQMIISFLALGFSRLPNYGSKLCPLNSTGGRGVANSFGRHVIKMRHNYAESNPLNPEGAGWMASSKALTRFFDFASLGIKNPVNVKFESATKLSYPDEFFDAIFTDPPYYDNIAYGYLSDFFYVWLKQIMKKLEPELFATPVVSISNEIISELPLTRGMGKEILKKKIPSIKTAQWYNDTLSVAFKEMYRVLKNDGIAVIVYAHKSTEGWEVLIESLLSSGFNITASWPINTEMEGRLESQETAALASSIYIVCRKWEKIPHGNYSEVKKEIKQYLDEKLKFLWEQEIRGADFFISAIGSAIEVFGKYESITDNSDKEISVKELLNDVRKIVTEGALKEVLESKISNDVSLMTRFYVLWRTYFGHGKVPYDDARKLATSIGLNSDVEFGKGFIKKEKDIIQLLGPEDRNVNEIDNPTELIDVLHKSLLLWKKGKKESMDEILDETGFSKKMDLFRHVAKAISESLGDSKLKEKNWIDQYLTIFSETKNNGNNQSKLF